MGKAEDGASLVALVPFIAEKGKRMWGAGADKGVCGYADLTAVSRVHMEYLFPFVFGVICVILGFCKTVPKYSYLIKRFAHVFTHPASSDLNPCPFVLVVVCCCCCVVLLCLLLSSGRDCSCLQGESLAHNLFIGGSSLLFML